MIEIWKNFWSKHLMKIKADKFWHFIAFREFTAILMRTGSPSVWVIAIGILLGIGKELWDRAHGGDFDFGDLMADIVGIFLAYMIDGMYIRILT